MPANNEIEVEERELGQMLRDLTAAYGTLVALVEQTGAEYIKVKAMGTKGTYTVTVRHTEPNKVRTQEGEAHDAGE